MVGDAIALKAKLKGVELSDFKKAGASLTAEDRGTLAAYLRETRDKEKANKATAN